MLLPLVQNDTELREYQFPVGFEDNWRGSITRLRVEIASAAVTRGDIKVGAIRLLQLSDTLSLAQQK